jgi:hypothetical protein
MMYYKGRYLLCSNSTKYQPNYMNHCWPKPSSREKEGFELLHGTSEQVRYLTWCNPYVDTTFSEIHQYG